jgi:peptidoglycan/LPS O-acetylase OafA/YrhL
VPVFVLGRRPALDGVRGVALLAVLGVHVGMHPGAPQPLTGGFLGVDLFFVLSGFLITSLLLQERQRSGSIHLGRFYLRRALRLLPALVGVLAGCWLLAAVWGTRGVRAELRKDTLGVLLYVQNWRLGLNGRTWGMVPHLWSLSVEEQFYLIWPAALAGLLALRARRGWIVGLALLGVVVPALLRLALYTSGSWRRPYFCTDTRADGLAAGCLLALLASWTGGPRGRWGRLALRAAAWPAAALLVGHYVRCNAFDPYVYRAGFSVVNLAAGVLLAAMLWSPPPLLAWVLESRPLGWLGRVSYGAYLWDLPVGYLVMANAGRAPHGVQAALLLAGPVLAGALSHYGLEAPFLRLKSRLEPHRDARALPARRAA